jgi:hypothetical protein
MFLVLAPVHLLFVYAFQLAPVAASTAPQVLAMLGLVPLDALSTGYYLASYVALLLLFVLVRRRGPDSRPCAVPDPSAQVSIDHGSSTRAPVQLPPSPFVRDATESLLHDTSACVRLIEVSRVWN